MHVDPGPAGVLLGRGNMGLCLQVGRLRLYGGRGWGLWLSRNKLLLRGTTARVGCWDLELARSPGGSHSRTSACRGAGGRSEVLWATCKFESRPKVRNPASSTAQSPSGIVQRILVHTARTSVRKPGACSLSSPGSRSHLAPLYHSSSFLCPPHLPFLPPKLNSTSGSALPRPPPHPRGPLGPSALSLHLLSGTASGCLLTSLAQRGSRAP